jgi:hypothetical protein
MAEPAGLVMGTVGILQAFQSVTDGMLSLAPDHASLIVDECTEGLHDLHPSFG